MRRIVASTGFLFRFFLFSTAGLLLFFVVALLPKRARGLAGLLAKGFSQVALFCLGLRCEFTGTIPLPRKPMLIVGNHMSYLDILVVARFFAPGFLAKAEVAAWPGISAWTERLGLLFVRRNCLQSRVRVIRALTKGLQQRSLCVFPEGTTTSRPFPLRENWNAGQMHAAKAAGVDLLVFGLAFEDPMSAAWTDDQTLVPHLLRRLSAPTQRMAFATQHIPHETTALLTARELSHLALATTRELCTQAQQQLGGHSHETLDANSDTAVRLVTPNFASLPLGTAG